MVNNQMEIPTKFWKEYESGDDLERSKKIEVIAKRINELFYIKKDSLRREVIKTVLQGYFDDIFAYVQSWHDSPADQSKENEQNAKSANKTEGKNKDNKPASLKS